MKLLLLTASALLLGFSLAHKYPLCDRLWRSARLNLLSDFRKSVKICQMQQRECIGLASLGENAYKGWHTYVFQFPKVDGGSKLQTVNVRSLTTIDWKERCREAFAYIERKERKKKDKTKA